MILCPDLLKIAFIVTTFALLFVVTTKQQMKFLLREWYLTINGKYMLFVGMLALLVIKLGEVCYANLSSQTCSMIYGL